MTKKKNVVEKFHKWFDKLAMNEKRDLYDLLTMVRGPDDEYKLGSKETPKHVVTMRIRYLLGLGNESMLKGMKNRYYPSYNITPFPSKDDIWEQVRGITNYHYAGHAKEAILRLVEMGIIS